MNFTRWKDFSAKLDDFMMNLKQKKISAKENNEKLCVVARAAKLVAKFWPNRADFFMDVFRIGILLNCLSWWIGVRTHLTINMKTPGDPLGGQVVYFQPEDIAQQYSVLSIQPE